MGITRVILRGHKTKEARCPVNGIAPMSGLKFILSLINYIFLLELGNGSDTYIRFI